jgi:hypothetical protein
MTSISTVGSSLLAQMATNRTAASIQPSSTPIQSVPAATSTSQFSTPQPSTLVTLSGTASGDETINSAITDVIYSKPQAVEESLFGSTRAWATNTQDDVSVLMARNRDRASLGSLADQWRGLGGALLSKLAATGTGYKQSLVDYSISKGVERTQAMDNLAQSGVQNGAASVSLTVKTRSGQSVELKILVNSGLSGGNRGIQVEVTSSGTLSSAERKALADLAEGFDQALEGLGQPDKLKLDMSKLMDYDSSALASVGLTVKNPQAKQALSSFSLHLGTDQKTLAFKGALGEVALNLDTDMPFGPSSLTSAQQRQSAIAAHLKNFDAAAERSHADEALLALFKDAFTQLHSAPSSQATAQADLLTPALTRQVQPLLSGLADFQASFSGDFEKTNDLGAVNEIGSVDYQLSQQTTVKRTGTLGDASITQTQSEKLDARYLKSRSGLMLDTSSGNYDIYKINDRSSSTTSIEIANKMLIGAVKTTEQQQLASFEKLVNHRTTEQGSTPLNKRFAELLR